MSPPPKTAPAASIPISKADEHRRTLSRIISGRAKRAEGEQTIIAVLIDILEALEK